MKKAIAILALSVSAAAFSATPTSNVSGEFTIIDHHKIKEVILYDFQTSAEDQCFTIVLEDWVPSINSNTFKVCESGFGPTGYIQAYSLAMTAFETKSNIWSWIRTDNLKAARLNIKHPTK